MIFYHGVKSFLRTKIEFKIIKQRQTRIKCGFVSVFVLLEVTNSRIKW